jgi:peptide deformylase
LDKDGKTVELETEGLLARAIQHEIDHLDGKLFIDKLSPIRKEMVKKKIKKRIAANDY